MNFRAIEKAPNQFVQANRGNNMLLTYITVWVFLAGIPGAMQILNSIEGSLENDVPMSVVNSDDDTVVLDSTNMVVIEMASLALPA
jgi:hypothetical protein